MARSDFADISAVVLTQSKKFRKFGTRGGFMRDGMHSATFSREGYECADLLTSLRQVWGTSGRMGMRVRATSSRRRRLIVWRLRRTRLQEMCLVAAQHGIDEKRYKE